MQLRSTVKRMDTARAGIQKETARAEVREIGRMCTVRGNQAHNRGAVNRKRFPSKEEVFTHVRTLYLLPEKSYLSTGRNGGSKASRLSL